jgi:ABC-type transporter Mla subunit MlaD
MDTVTYVINVNLPGAQGQGPSLADVVALINQRSDQIMATIQQVQDDLDQIKQQSSDYIAARDAIDVTLNATIADLTAQLAAGKADAATVQAGIDAAFDKAEADKGLLVPPSAPSA